MSFRDSTAFWQILQFYYAINDLSFSCVHPGEKIGTIPTREICNDKNFCNVQRSTMLIVQVICINHRFIRIYSDYDVERTIVDETKTGF